MAHEVLQTRHHDVNGSQTDTSSVPQEAVWRDTVVTIVTVGTAGMMITTGAVIMTENTPGAVMTGSTPELVVTGNTPCVVMGEKRVDQSLLFTPQPGALLVRSVFPAAIGLRSKRISSIH